MRHPSKPLVPTWIRCSCFYHVKPVVPWDIPCRLLPPPLAFAAWFCFQLSDVHAVFGAALDNVTHAGYFNDFLSLLHHVLIMPTSPVLGASAWSSLLAGVRDVVLGPQKVGRYD